MRYLNVVSLRASKRLREWSEDGERNKGFSQTLSSNTLRNASSNWSFPKAERFSSVYMRLNE
jgi:hypothetical protein